MHEQRRVILATYAGDAVKDRCVNGCPSDTSADDVTARMQHEHAGDESDDATYHGCRALTNGDPA